MPFIGINRVSVGVNMVSTNIDMISTNVNLASTNAKMASTTVNMASTGVNIREFDEFRIMQAVCQKNGGTGPSIYMTEGLSCSVGISLRLQEDPLPLVPFFSGINWKYNNKSIVHKLDKLEPKWV